MKVLFLGDIVTGGILPYLEYSPLSEEIIQFLNSFDLRIATLETAIGDNLAFDRMKMEGRGNIIYSPIKSAQLLIEMGINVVSLANNHLFDLGVEGFRVTTQYLKAHNIAFTGAGENIEEAFKPVIIKRDNIKIAIIAACSSNASQVAYVPIATETKFGVAPLSEDRICEEITYYKKECDYVIVLPHWGKEYTHFPLKESVSLSKKMIEAGADLIIGSHTHTPQPKIRFKGKDIYFSLGNGLFPDFLITTPRPIWYPNPQTIDLTTIPHTYDYPFPVNSPLYRRWKESSRIGIAVETIITENEFKTSSRFTYLDELNALKLKRNRLLRIWLKFIEYFIKSKCYDEGMMLRRFKRIPYKVVKCLKYNR